MAEKSGFRKFMGGVTALVASPIAVAGGLVAGTIKSIEDGSLESFGDAFEKTADTIFDGATQVGEDHGPEFVTTVAAIVVGGTVTNGMQKKS